MRYLLKKMMRDMGLTRGASRDASRGQYIATIVVILLGVAVYAGMMSASASVNKTIGSFYDTQRLADLWVSVPDADETMVTAIEALPGVEAAQARVQLSATSGSHSFIVNTVTANPSVNIPFMESGRLPASANECVVDRAYAAANGLEVGATLHVTIGDVDARLLVTGIFNSPEYLYLAKDVTAQPDHASFGAIFVAPALLANLPANQIVVRAAPGTDLVHLKAAIQQVGFPSGDGVITDRTQLLSWMMLNQDMNQYGQIGWVFAVIFFLVAAAIIFISMSKNVDAQRGQIGNMKALGVKSWLITSHYVSYSLITCLVGCALGAVAGLVAVKPGIEAIFTAFYTMPASAGTTGFGINAGIATLLALAFGLTATVLSVRAPLRETAAAAMRPKVPRRIRPIMLERRTWLWSHLSFGHKIVARNLFLHKPRAFLSSIGVVGCVGLLLASFGFMGSIKDVLGAKFLAMNQYDIAVTLNTPVMAGDGYPWPDADIAAAWGQATLPASLGNADETISTNLVALDANCGAIALYDASGAAMSVPADGVLLPKVLADKYHLGAGSIVALTLTEPGQAPLGIQVTVVGVVLEYLQQDVYTSFDYLRSLGVVAPVSAFFLDVAPSADAIAVAASLNGNTAVAQAITRAELADSWSQELSLMNSLMYIMIAASAVLALAVVYNISVINIVERRRDIATCKVLGYRRAEVNRLVFDENFVVTAVGVVLGLPVGVAMLHMLLGAVVSDTMMVPAVISPLSVALAIGLGFAFTGLANQMLRRQIGRIDMVESLKSVD